MLIQNHGQSIFGSKPLLRFSRTQYGIFKHFQDANLLTLVIRIPQSSGLFHHRRDRRYCRARAGQNSRHDRQLFYVCFARSHADSCLRRPPRQHVFAVAKEKTVWRQRPETQSTGHFRILRKKRTQRRNRTAAGDPFSADSQRGPRRRRHASPDELQGDCVARRRRPQYFYWRSGGRGDGRRRTVTLFHLRDRKSTRLNSSHVSISYAVFCLKKKIDELRCASSSISL